MDIDMLEPDLEPQVSMQFDTTEVCLLLFN